MDLVDVSRVETDRVAGLGRLVLELQKAVRELRWTGDFRGALQAQDEKVENDTVPLEHEALAHQPVMVFFRLYCWKRLKLTENCSPLIIPYVLTCDMSLKEVTCAKLARPEQACDCTRRKR